jgi:hypothetical protein
MSVLESSVLVRTLRRVGRTSLLVTGLSALGRGFRRIDQAIAQAAAEKNAAEDAPRVRAIVAGSRLVQALDRLFSAPAVAWRYSRVRPIVESVQASVRELELSQRIRLLGWMIIVAVVTRAALFVLVGNRPSAVTLGIWAIVVVVGAFMMSAPAQIGAAWVDWRRRRGF